MPSIAQIKHIASLRMPKFRQKYGQFVVEGRKAVEEVFHSGWLLEGIWATESFLERFAPPYPCDLMTEEENKKCTSFDTAPGVMALVNMPKSMGLNLDVPFVLALDGISDPGNMGTIIRLAGFEANSSIRGLCRCFQSQVFGCHHGVFFACGGGVY
jgi:TrmH family RNA methyltransferase